MLHKLRLKSNFSWNFIGKPLNIYISYLQYDLITKCMRKFENIGRIKIFIKDRNKKSTLLIIKEVFVLIKTKKEFPFYYFKYLYKKDVKNYLDYLSTGEINAIGRSKQLHNPGYNSILDNKLYFTLLVAKSTLNIPKLVSYNLGNSFYFNDSIKEIRNKSELIVFFENIFAKSKIEGIFFRPLSNYGGKGCFKLTRIGFKTELEEKLDLLMNENYVHTEIIKQHEDIDKINDKSVSTLRIISFITPENQTKIISAFMRFGVGNSVVDNSSSGGFFVGVNMNDGTLKKTGHYLFEYGGGVIYEHPDSGFKFEGFLVPYFKEACKEVLKGVKVIPDRFIGWDVAITQNGPIIVEGNRRPNLLSAEIGYGGLLKNQYIKKLVEDLKLNPE